MCKARESTEQPKANANEWRWRQAAGHETILTVARNAHARLEQRRALALLVTANLEVLATLDGMKVHSLAVGIRARQPKHNLLRGLCLLPEDGLRLPAESALLAIVTPLSLRIQRSLSSLVLRNLVNRVLIASLENERRNDAGIRSEFMSLRRGLLPRRVPADLPSSGFPRKTLTHSCTYLAEGALGLWDVHLVVTSGFRMRRQRLNAWQHARLPFPIFRSDVGFPKPRASFVSVPFFLGSSAGSCLPFLRSTVLPCSRSSVRFSTLRTISSPPSALRTVRRCRPDGRVPLVCAATLPVSPAVEKKLTLLRPVEKKLPGEGWGWGCPRGRHG